MAAARPVDEIFLGKAVDVVLTHLDQHEFSGNELAAELNLSREQTHRKLKKYTGLPTGKFVSYIRILKAYRLLFLNGYTVSEIAYKVGFESPSYFNKCFKEAFGIPPGDIRRNVKTFSLQDKLIFRFYKTPKLNEILHSRGLTLTADVDEIATPVPQNRKKAALFLLSVVAMLFIGFYYKSGETSNNFSAQGHRIAIIPFDNQTGDSAYAVVGDIGSSWISGRLEEVPDVRIIPYLTVREYLPYFAVLDDDPEDRPTFREVVDADYLITGAYFLKEQNLYFDARLVDARSQELIYPIPPVSGPKDSVMQVLELLRLKIAGLLTNLEEVKLGKLNPPDYRAYLYYLKGLEFVKSGSYQERGRRYLEKAIEVQPDFVMPHLFLTWYYRGPKRDSLVHKLKFLTNATVYEKNIATELSYLMSRDYMASLRFSLKMLEDYPQDYYFNMIAGHRAKTQYMPDLAMEVLSRLKDPLSRDIGMVWHYYKIWNMTGSMIIQKKYSEVIAYLNSLPPDQENDAIPAIYICAYVQLGNTKDEVEQLVTRFCRNDARRCAYLNTVASYEFNLLSQEHTAKYFALKAKNLIGTMPDKLGLSFDLIDVLYLAGDFAGAKKLLRKALLESPQNLELKIYLSYVEASLGNVEVAEQLFNGISNDTLIFWRRHEFEYQAAYLKARMYAISRKNKAAVDLIRESLERGQLSHHWDFERDVFLKNIFSNSDFRQMVRPRQLHNATPFQ